MNFNNLIKSINEPTLINHNLNLKSEIKGIIDYSYKNEFTIIFSYDYNSSYEVDLTLLFNNDKLFYVLDDLKHYFDNAKLSLQATQIKDVRLMEKWLQQVDTFLQDHLNNIICNQSKIKTELNKIKMLEADIYEKSNISTFKNEVIERLWSTKDYSRLVELLKSKKQLTELEKKNIIMP